MISSKKKFLKRIGLGIIITILSITLFTFGLTKIIYDSTFSRYDVPVEIPSGFSQTVSHRVAHYFDSGKNRLCGHLYESESNQKHGLIVLVPGYRAAADEYLQQIEALTALGWGVFCFDPTGSCQSEGESAVGFSQAVKDLTAALDYANANHLFGYEKLYLMGHSRGGYAVCGVLGKEYPITAAVTVSGVNSCMDAILQPVADKIGPLAYSNYSMLWLYQAALFGANTVNLDAAQEIKKSKIPVLIVQGSNDALYPTDQYSVYAHAKEDALPNAEYYLCEQAGQNGHTDLLFDADGAANSQLITQIHQFLQSHS